METQNSLLTPTELDKLLRYGPGKSERLARRGKIPHIKLPDGSIRFKPDELKLLGIGSALSLDDRMDALAQILQNAVRIGDFEIKKMANRRMAAVLKAHPEDDE